MKLLTFFLTLAYQTLLAVSLVGEPEVAPTATEATVRWKLDVPAGGKVRFGENEAQLDQSIEGGIAAEHSIKLPGLKPRTRYFYSVGTARKPLAKGSFTTSGGGLPGALGRIVRDILPSGEKKPEPPPPPAKPAAPATAPPTRATWGSLPTLQDHFDRHGADFGAKSPDDYAAQAWFFRERATAQKLPMKLDDDGTVRAFDPRSRAFAAYNRNGTTKTYFRPESASYWQRQPGTPITTPPWKPSLN